MKKNFLNIEVAGFMLLALSAIFFFRGDNFSRDYISEDARLLENIIARISALEARNEHILTQLDMRNLNVNTVNNKPIHLNEALFSRVEKIEKFIAQIEHIKNQNTRAHESDYGMQIKIDQSTAILNEAVREVMEKMFDERFQAQQRLPENRDQLFEDSSNDVDNIRDYIASQLREELALSKQQNLEFKELVERYSDQHINVNSQYHREALENVTDPQEIEEYLNSVLSEADELNTVFEGDFSAVLDPNQEEIYRNLPADVRAIIRENGAIESYLQ